MLPNSKKPTPQDDFEYYEDNEPAANKQTKPSNAEPELIYEEDVPAKKKQKPAAQDDWYAE